MMKLLQMLLAALVMGCMALPVQAQSETQFTANPIVKAQLISKTRALTPGMPLEVGVLLTPQEGWHTYYKDPGEAGLATEIKWLVSDGLKVASDIRWPEPTKLDEDGIMVNAYKGQVLLPVTIEVDKDVSLLRNYRINAQVSWLVCKDICIPERTVLDLNLPAVPDKAMNSEYAQLFIVGTNDYPAAPQDVNRQLSQHAPTFALTLLFAVLGGLILNLMPCVLPVLSLKALTLVKKAGSHPAVARRHGIAYTLGVLSSFALIASVLIGLQHAGEAVGWGYQMQSPTFVGFLILLLFTVGLNLSGVFELPVLLGHIHVADDARGRSSFLTGVLATAVATPCTAPFMASALGVALTLPPFQAMLVFLALGFGLALPFLLISFCPPLLRLLPKPGAWMNTFKQVLAFAMYGSVIWLLWVLTLQTSAGGMVLALSALLALVAALVLFRGIVALALVSLVAVVSLTMFSQLTMQGSNKLPMQHAQSGVQIVDFSRAKLEELRAQGKTVFVDATAAWCITCQVNARTAIHTERAMEKFKRRGAVLMIADWTSRNAEITQFLAEFGYNGVPLYVVYPAGGEPKVLPQILTTDIVVNAIP
jgi:thiol:disulfide interchange protein DsbD